MTEQEILEGNKLIAEFMGITKTPFTNNGGSGYTCQSTQFNEFSASYYGEEKAYEYVLNCLNKYHTSWDWLMPVVEKAFNTTSQDDMTFAGLVLFEYGICASIEDIWKAAVEYVKWYNTHTHSETKTIK